LLYHFPVRWRGDLALRRLEALLLITVFVNYAAAGLLANTGSTAAYEWTYDLVPPMPQFSSEAPELNFTIPYPVPKPSPVSGEISVLVIAVEFKDYNHTLSIEEIASQTINRLNAYYSYVSYGLASVVGRVIGWARLPHKLSEYGADNGPFVDCQNGDGYPDTWELLKDAAPLIVNEVNIIEYQHILVLHAGYGQESSRRPDDIWSVSYIRRTVETPQGSIDRFAVVPEFQARGLNTLGVYTHEFGHLLGLPDLYSRSTEEVGPWDLMARGAWNGNPPGSSPAEMLAWDRIFLSWLTPEHLLKVGTQARMNVTIDPLELPSSGVHVVRVQTASQDSKHYYLVEVRQKLGFDAALPSNGVLITYIDETKTNPVKVIDAVQKTSALDDATFQVGQKYSDGQNSMVISIVTENGSSFSVVVDTMAPSTDVAVESLTLNQTTVHPNSTVSLDVRITNEGTLKAKPFLTNIFLNETLFASRKMSLGAGGSQQIQLSWKPSNGGTYFFKVVLDPENVLSESNKENNVKVLRVVVGYTLTLQVSPPGAGGDLQWWLIVNGVNQTFVGVGEFQVGVVPGPNTLQIQPLIYVNPSSRYAFRQWGDGSVSNPRTIDLSSDIALSVDFSTQYLLSLEPNGGVTSVAGWYDSGTPAVLSATSPSSVVDKQSRSVFLNWSGDIQSNSTNLVVNMNRPYHVIANWKIQYYLQIESPYSASGEGWYDANTQAAISLSSPITTDNGTRQLFVQWSGDLSGLEPSQLITMSGPKFVSAVWTTQYELTMESEYGHTSGSGWYSLNTQAAFNVDTVIIDAANGTRRVFIGWSGDATGAGHQGSVTMDSPKIIRANWGTQHLIAFTTHGVRNGTILTITVDGLAYQVKVPQVIALWHDAGSPVSFSANATATQGYRRYIFEDWRNRTGGTVKSPQIILKPETYTAFYREVSLFPCIIATVTFGSELSPEVQFLRNFRDRLVLSTRAGSAFMNVFNMWYYSLSPEVANFIAGHDAAKGPMRIAIYPLMGILELSSMTYSALAFSPELAIVTAGVVASALIGVIYLTPIALFLVRFLAKRRMFNTYMLKALSVSCLFVSATLTLGELTGVFGLLAVATSALVLTTLVSTTLLLSFALIGLWSRVGLSTKMKRVVTLRQ